MEPSRYRALLPLAAALLAVTLGCGSSSSPAAPSATPATPAMPTPAPAPSLPLIPKPSDFDPTFWGQFAHGALEGLTVPLQRLTTSPTLYVRTVDDDGVAVDPVTISTVITAMQQVAALWGGGRVSLAGVVKDVQAHDHQPGTLTVHFSSTAALGSLTCGDSSIGIDGGVIRLNYHYSGFSCGCVGSAVSPHVAKHELGHAFGYYHTDRVDDVMNATVDRCDDMPSAREQSHAVYAYQLPVGSLN